MLIPAFDILPWAALPPVRRQAILALRRAVFCGEQGIDPALEFDGLEEECEHLQGWCGDRLVAVARLRRQPAVEVCQFATLGGDVGKIGRVVVAMDARRRGVGRRLMSAAHGWLDARQTPGVIHAQAYLEDWYARLGWRRVGPVFAEAGIPHVEMVRAASDPGGGADVVM